MLTFLFAVLILHPEFRLFITSCSRMELLPENRKKIRACTLKCTHKYTPWRSLQVENVWPLRKKNIYCISNQAWKRPVYFRKTSTWIWIDPSSRAGLSQQHGWRDQACLCPAGSCTLHTQACSCVFAANSLQTFQFQTAQPPFILSRLWHHKKKCLHSSRDQNPTQVP